MTVEAGTRLERMHSEENGPVYFDDGPGGRFNPRGVDGIGTCYFGMQPIVAFVEVFRRKFVTQSAIDERRLTGGATTRTLTLFDVTADANRFVLDDIEVTASLSAGPMRASQAAAAELVPHVDGIWYPVRHGLAGDLFGVALFGDKGEAPTNSVLADPKTDNISDDLLRQATERFGYVILPHVPRVTGYGQP